MRIDRRRFLKRTLGSGALLGLCDLDVSAENPRELPTCHVRTLTSEPRHHFFGYYGICPWNRAGTFLLSLESAFQDHFPTRDEPAAIGLVDAATGAFEKIAQTHAWNLQQGAMLHWNPLNANEILYNDRQDNEIVSIVLNIQTGRKRVLPAAINGLSHNGRYALSLSYGRLGRLRKTVSYQGIEDPTRDVPHPDNDGVFVMDMQTGKRTLAVSVLDFYKLIKDRHPELKDRHLWCNHTVFNKSDTRFFFLGRSMENGRLETGMFTADRDGGDLREVIPYGSSVSHFDWRNDTEIVATFRYQGRGRRHVLFTDGRQDYRVLGDGTLDFDGHCTFAPDGDRLATDRKHDLNQSLILHNVETGKGKVLVTLDMKHKRHISGHLRCDFHPRWDRTGDAICFDGIDQETGTRQLHVAYLD